VLELFLRTRLPDYMVPSVFVQLDAIPLTPNGKVDRATLPSPDATNILRDEIYVAPSTDCEKQVTAIVCGLLGFDHVGANDNFFLLGGHSLLGTQLISRLRDVFGVELPLRTVFDHPTVTAISAEIERLQQTQPPAATVRRPAHTPVAATERS
jgi:acyl carrier protein